MKPEKPKNLGFKQIYFNLDKILFLFFLTFMMIEFVWLPSNSWIAGLFAPSDRLSLSILQQYFCHYKRFAIC